MNPQELRIGNYVNFKNRTDIDYCEVTSVDCGGYIHVQRNFKDGLHNDDQPECISDCTPIPLTEEWLERFGLTKKYMENVFEDGGFEQKTDGSLWYTWVKGIFNLEIQDNGEIWFEVYSHYNHIKHVHQLQNIYFALTEEELKLQP